MGHLHRILTQLNQSAKFFPTPVTRLLYLFSLNQTRTTTICIGFTFVFGSLFSKTWRVHKVTRITSAKKLVRNRSLVCDKSFSYLFNLCLLPYNVLLFIFLLPPFRVPPRFSSCSVPSLKFQFVSVLICFLLINSLLVKIKKSSSVLTYFENAFLYGNISWETPGNLSQSTGLRRGICQCTSFWIFQIIRDLHLFGVIGVLILIDAVILLLWNFLDPFQKKIRYLPALVKKYIHISVL